MGRGGQDRANHAPRCLTEEPIVISDDGNGMREQELCQEYLNIAGPALLAAEIVESLEAALEEFRAVEGELDSTK